MKLNNLGFIYIIYRLKNVQLHYLKEIYNFTNQQNF